MVRVHPGERSFFMLPYEVEPRLRPSLLPARGSRHRAVSTVAHQPRRRDLIRESCRDLARHHLHDHLLGCGPVCFPCAVGGCGHANNLRHICLRHAGNIPAHFPEPISPRPLRPDKLHVLCSGHPLMLAHRWWFSIDRGVHFRSMGDLDRDTPQNVLDGSSPDEHHLLTINPQRQETGNP